MIWNEVQRVCHKNSLNRGETEGGALLSGAALIGSYRVSGLIRVPHLDPPDPNEWVAHCYQQLRLGFRTVISQRVPEPQQLLSYAPSSVCPIHAELGPIVPSNIGIGHFSSVFERVNGDRLE